MTENKLNDININKYDQRIIENKLNDIKINKQCVSRNK